MSHLVSLGVSPIREMERPLFGQFVRQVAAIRTEQLEECLELQKANPKRLGEILLEQGLLSHEQILEILSLQAAWVAKAIRADFGQDMPIPTFFSLCLPAYNEAANIRAQLDSATAILPCFIADYEVVVVDDGSRDETGDIVKDYSLRNPRVRLIQHSQNRGYGGAVTTGLRAAKGDYVAFMDSDEQFSLLDLPQLLMRLPESDVVIGYRHSRADPWPRRVNAWAWNRLIRLILDVRVKDLDCAFKVFSRDVIERLNLSATGACINAEIMAQCVRSDLRIHEIPVAHFPRFEGDPTGADLRVVLKAFRELPLLWKYRTQSLAIDA